MSRLWGNRACSVILGDSPFDGSPIGLSVWNPDSGNKRELPKHACAVCGFVVKHPNEAELRRMANEHAETHAEVTT